ncbi:hypothetical protein Ssed_2251 [Shewanella sediminis HAW-EB3]|uniref:Lipoprotein n=1 Tax=Shewanella sediminis (strain HAW-EB3) TaxID=425104 RepID=A8FVI7_SHESH|nr:hypothetical protein [Shewanella sediminis]ABV36860.1 hypothetical protein Ssed_2251 [Shewanella sediminis HAW-EB3]
MFLRSFFAFILIASLSACHSEDYVVNTDLIRDGITIGPTQVTIGADHPVEFPIELESVNILRLSLSDNLGQIDLTAQLIYRKGDFLNIETLPGFTLLPDGQEASLEFQIDNDAPLYQWTVSVTKEEH